MMRSTFYQKRSAYVFPKKKRLFTAILTEGAQTTRRRDISQLWGKQSNRSAWDIEPFVALARVSLLEGRYVGNDNVAMTVSIDLEEEGKWRNNQELNLKR